jgi:outer membrane biosynthesis protein TonB
VSTRTALDRVLSIDARPPLFGWAGVALSMHVGLASLLAHKAIAAPAEPALTEIELVPVEPPAPPPPPPPEQPVSEKTEEVAPARAIAVAKSQPALGKAAPILAAKTDEPAKPDEPASFVTDPDGKEFGSGVVGAGGAADQGTKDGAPFVPSPPAPTANPIVAAAPTVTPPANLSRAPKLAAADPCRGYFPAGADDDEANVSVAVVVRPDGSVASANVVNETVRGQGFGKAARSCLLATRFSPALDSSGHSTHAAATVIVRFAR